MQFSQEMLHGTANYRIRRDRAQRHRADQGIYGPPTTEKLLALLQSWDDDPEEQRETLAYLQRVLDEDRLGTQKLFP